MVWFPTSLGIRLSHIHTDETKQIFKLEQQNVLEWSVNTVKEMIHWVLTLYKQSALRRVHEASTCEYLLVCIRVTFIAKWHLKVILTSCSPVLTPKQLLFKLHQEITSTTLALNCGKALRAQALQVINWAAHSHLLSFIRSEIRPIMVPFERYWTLWSTATKQFRILMYLNKHKSS